MTARSHASSGASVTLIFFNLHDTWYLGNEPLINIGAAGAQGSRLVHTEIALGEDSGRNGEMTNVLRIYNDDVGVELTSRTGKSPQYRYVQVGCSQQALDSMLIWAKKQRSKPFSTHGFCAELVAACLQVGGLMDKAINPGSMTPKALFDMYGRNGAVHANPCTLRQSLGTMSVAGAGFGMKIEPTYRSDARSAAGLMIVQRGAPHSIKDSRLQLTLNSIDMRDPSNRRR